MRHFAISDIHGCLKSLEELLFSRLRITEDDHLFFLGDYIDRGPDSKGVLDLLMSLQQEFPKTIILRGNHEQLMIKACKNDDGFDLWMRNGAAITLNSFGIRKSQSRSALAKLPDKYCDFIQSMGYYAMHERFILSHAGLDLSRRRPLIHPKAMLWITEMEENRLFLQDRILIHGHRCYPLKHLRKVLYEGKNWHYSIDSGCVYDYPGMGYLSALELGTMEMMSVKRIDIVQR